jgi:UDP-N-acetylglucosamine 2-epimerase (non-hydrolysing)
MRGFGGDIMKVMTLFGTRPEIIRLSEVMRKLDEACEHIMVHTGQNFDPNLSDVFLKELRIRTPDHELSVRAETSGDQIGKIIAATEKVMLSENPDRILILGDTNSALSAIPAARLGIPVFHMEAGNRCYDDRVPEEINRRIIDHSSSVLLPYTERSKENLVREGIERERIFVTGNPIFEVIEANSDIISNSEALERLGLEKENFILVTVHRAENVDREDRLREIVKGVVAVSEKFNIPAVMSTHPRTAEKLNRFGVDAPGITLFDPLPFSDFVHLEKSARLVLTDSGTVQEECCIFGIPNVTIRDVTERPETMECGSNVLSGAEHSEILRLSELVLNSTPDWIAPAEYLKTNVSETVSRIVLGRLSTRRHA